MTRPIEPSIDDGDHTAPERQDAAGEAAGDPGAELARERDEYRDRLLRTTADFDNYRKRVERERRELGEYAAAEVLGELLPIVDDLERALSAADETGSVARYREGVELIYRHLLDVLKKRGVAPIDAVGAPFDPHLHHAVAREPSGTHEEGEVIAELRKGYRLRDRLLRASLVKVASRD